MNITIETGYGQKFIAEISKDADLDELLRAIQALIIAAGYNIQQVQDRIFLEE